MIDYYNQHKHEFVEPESVEVDYIELSLNDLLSKTKITDQALQDYYDNNKASFSSKEQWRLAHILIHVKADATADEIKKANDKARDIIEQLKSGKSFSALAKQYSDDILNAKKGGELPWFEAGTLNDDVEAVLPTLGGVGKTSSAIRTVHGFEIVKVLGHKPAKPLAFDDVKGKIQTLLQNDKATRQFATLNEELANLSFTHPTSLNEVAELTHLQVKRSPKFSKAGLATGLFAKANVVNTAFQADVLLQGNNSDVIQIEDNHIVVLRVAKHKPKQQLSFNDVKVQVRDAVQHKSLQDYALQLAQNIMVGEQKKTRY